MMAVEYSIGVTNRFGALNFDDEDLEDFQPKKEKIKVKEESHEDRPKKQDKKTAKQQSKETKPASTKKDFVNEDSRRGGTYVEDLFSPCNVECTCFCTVTPSCCQTTCVLFIFSIYPFLVLYLYCFKFQTSRKLPKYNSVDDVMKYVVSILFMKAINYSFSRELNRRSFAFNSRCVHISHR